MLTFLTLTFDLQTDCRCRDRQVVTTKFDQNIFSHFVCKVQTDRQTDRHIDRHIDRQTDRQTHRQTDIQTHRQTDR